MKILMIGNKSSYLAQKMTQEAESMKLYFRAVSPKTIRIKVDSKGFSAQLIDGTRLLDFDVFYFYAMGSDLPELAELAKYLASHKKVVVEASLIAGRLPFDKLDWRDKPSMPTLDYQMFFKFKEADYAKIKYPVVIKKLESSLGRGVFKAESETHLRGIIEKIGKKIIVQKYIETKCDYRVLVVGNRALGAMKRIKSEGNFRSNRKPEETLAFQLPSEVLKACVKASKEKGLAVAGVDLVKYRGKYYLLEINSSPQCRVFEKKTGVKVTKEILKYLQGLSKKN